MRAQQTGRQGGHGGFRKPKLDEQEADGNEARPWRARSSGQLLLEFSAGDAAFAQKQGGVLRVPHFDSPASMSMLEESTVAVNRPMMGVFNNLVMYKQDVPQNSMKSIVPELATSLERGGDRADPAAAPRRQVARRQALYGPGRQMHLGPPCRQDEREAAHQSA
jgi:hypothetical protein